MPWRDPKLEVGRGMAEFNLATQQLAMDISEINCH